MFVIYAASGPRLVGGTGDDLPRYQKALQELEQLDLRPAGNTDRYWETIKATLLRESSSQDLQQAIKEWGRGRKGVRYAPDSTCQLCGKDPIAWVFPIYNKVLRKNLDIGQECIRNFIAIQYRSDISGIREQISREIREMRAKGTTPTSETDELFELQQAITAIVRGAAGSKDFDVRKHLVALGNVLKVCNALGIKTGNVTYARKAQEASSPLFKLAYNAKVDISRDTLKVLEIVEAIVGRWRKPTSDKVETLKALKNLLIKVFQGQGSNDLIVGLWDDVMDHRHGLVNTARKLCDEAKGEISKHYDAYYGMVKPYPYLEFVLSSGVNRYRKEYDNKLQGYEDRVLSSQFAEKIIRSLDPDLTEYKTDNLFPPGDLSNSSLPEAVAASRMVAFLQALRQGAWQKSIKTVEETFRIGPIKDQVGVQAAVLHSAEDSHIQPSERGVKALDDFDEGITMRNPGIVEVLREEVDDLHKTRFESLKVHEKMSDDLGFDVQATFKAFDARNEADNRLCRKVVLLWQQGKKPDADDIQSLMLRRAQMSGADKPSVSMWQDLRAELLAPVGRFVKESWWQSPFAFGFQYHYAR